MRSTAFQRCEKCDGLGFLRKGEFGLDRAYVKCPYCGGIGQKYLEQGPPASSLVLKTAAGGSDTPAPGL